MADDFTLKWDAQNQELYGEDPSTGDRIPVPFDSVNANSVNADDLDSKRQAAEHHYTRSYDGGDPDARLDAALSDANTGEVIYLENADYIDNRSIGTDLHFIGTARHGRGTTVSGDWTFATSCDVSYINVSGAFVFQGISSSVFGCDGGGSVTSENDRLRYIGCSRLDLTFASGTAGGIVDGCYAVAVTDNGSNTVGDIA